MPPSDIDLPSTQVLRFPSSRKAWGKRFRPCSIAWPAVSVRLGGSMNHFRRTPHGGGAGRNRTRDYRAGADRGPLADIGHYNCARADPAVRTDRNGRELAVLRPGNPAQCIPAVLAPASEDLLALFNLRMLGALAVV